MSGITIDNDVPPPFKETRLAMPEDKAPAAAPQVHKRVRIMLEDSIEIPPTGQFFSVNDNSYVLRPGEPADVPEELVEVLDHAVMDVPIQQGDKVVGYRKRLRFPYRVLVRDIN